MVETKKNYKLKTKLKSKNQKKNRKIKFPYDIWILMTYNFHTIL